MQGWLDPKGPEPTATYWVRRLVVLAALVAVVVTIAFLVWPNDRAMVAEAPSSPEPSPVVSPASPALEPPPSPVATQSPVPETEIPPPNCDVQALGVEVDGPNPVGVDAANADFVITVNTSQAICVLDLASQPVTLIMVSGADRIWASSDCPDWQPTQSLTLTSGEPAQIGIGWPVRRSSGCELVDTQLGAGTYVATATIGQQSGRFVTQLTAG